MRMTPLIPVIWDVLGVIHGLASTSWLLNFLEVFCVQKENQA
jgi:hypothetical protein